MELRIKFKRFFVVIVLCLVVVFIGHSYYKILYKHNVTKIFASVSQRYSEELESPVFKLGRIIIYSDANIEDLSEKKDLSDINISQFTDFSIFIDNKIKDKELTAENTVNSINISNIVVTPTQYGKQKVFFKNIENQGIYKSNGNGVRKINYTVIHSNEEKAETNSDNIFFTDCSDPLTLSYVNENIFEHQDMSNTNKKISLDGSIIKHLGIDLDSLGYKISFVINLENNLGEHFKCKYAMDINLDSDKGGICTGFIMQNYDLSTFDYKFRKID